jgi:hypothetical protein
VQSRHYSVKAPEIGECDLPFGHFYLPFLKMINAFDPSAKKRIMFIL